MTTRSSGTFFLNQSDTRRPLFHFLWEIETIYFLSSLVKNSDPSRRKLTFSKIKIFGFGQVERIVHPPGPSANPPEVSREHFSAKKMTEFEQNIWFWFLMLFPIRIENIGRWVSDWLKKSAGRSGGLHFPYAMRTLIIFLDYSCIFPAEIFSTNLKYCAGQTKT